MTQAKTQLRFLFYPLEEPKSTIEKSNFLSTYNQKCYQIESVCKNVKDLPIEDGRHILFLNTKGVDGKISTDLEALFEYINGGEASIGKETDNELVKLIDDCVEKTNANEQ